MEPSNIALDKITIDGDYVNYNGERLMIKTEWYPVYFNKQYKILKVMISKDETFKNLLKKIDEIVEKNVPSNCKQTKLVKTFGESVYVQPKYKFAVIYDEGKNELKCNTFEKDNIECRFVFGLSSIKKFNNFYGVSLKCLQVQVRNKKKTVLPCMF